MPSFYHGCLLPALPAFPGFPMYLPGFCSLTVPPHTPFSTVVGRIHACLLPVCSSLLPLIQRLPARSLFWRLWTCFSLPTFSHLPRRATCVQTLLHTTTHTCHGFLRLLHLPTRNHLHCALVSVCWSSCLFRSHYAFAANHSPPHTTPTYLPAAYWFSSP